MSRTRLIVGNWKMHGSRAMADTLLSGVRDALDPTLDCRVALCVPFPFLAQAQSLLRGSAVAWGAQTLSEHPQGAHTGDVSAAMLKDFGCSFVIVGHSERRMAHGEHDRRIGRQAVAALDAGLTPIVCIGETAAQREAGRTGDAVLEQLDALLSIVGAERLASCVIAYEPLWAIGSGQTAAPALAQQVHALIRRRIAAADAAAARCTPVLYGGSVKPATAADLFAQPDIDGGLIGGASLVAADFVAIAHAGRGWSPVR